MPDIYRKDLGFQSSLIFFMIFLGQQLTDASTCGDFLKLSSGSSGTLSSPGYPLEPYPSLTHCVWLLEAPPFYSVSLTVSALDSRENTTSSTCLDNLEVRDGNALAKLHLLDCHLVESKSFTSAIRWLWVRFKTGSDTGGVGFIANYSVSYSGLAVTSTPVVSCPSSSFQCRNKECITYSYVCDNENDCGCEDEDCDENNCVIPELDMMTKLAIGISTGTGIFLVIFLGIGFLDIFLKRRQEENYKKQMEEQKKNRRRKPIMNIEKKQDGSMALPVPLSSRSNSTSASTLRDVQNSPRDP